MLNRCQKFDQSNSQAGKVSRLFLAIVLPELSQARVPGANSKFKENHMNHLFSIQLRNVKQLHQLDRISLTARAKRWPLILLKTLQIQTIAISRPPTVCPTGRSLSFVWPSFLQLTWITCSSSWITTRTETWRGWRSR